MTVTYKGINSLEGVIPGILITPPKDTVDLPLLLKLPHALQHQLAGGTWKNRFSISELLSLIDFWMESALSISNKHH